MDVSYAQSPSPITPPSKRRGRAFRERWAAGAKAIACWEIFFLWNL
jgi:hypothetical protein